jgi:hypothetical protein
MLASSDAHIPMHDVHLVQPDWKSAPEWASSWGFAPWKGGAGEWCWFAGEHPMGVHHITSRSGRKHPFVPFPPMSERL